MEMLVFGPLGPKPEFIGFSYLVMVSKLRLTIHCCLHNRDSAHLSS